MKKDSPFDVRRALDEGAAKLQAGARAVGPDRVAELLRRPAVVPLAARDILDLISAEIRVYVENVPQHDDVTMVVKVA